MPQITPFLWFDSEAEAAVDHYISVFPNSRVTLTTRYDAQSSEMSQRPAGSVMTVSFELDGKPFMALNGGPMYKINEAVSFVIDCQTQQEIDHYWDALSAGGETLACGWLRDKFGLCWQVVPAQLEQWLQDPASSAAVTAAVLQMVKLDLDELRRAAEGA